MGMAQLPLLPGGETLLEFQRWRLSIYKGRYYREVWDIAPVHLVSRRRKAPTPGGQNPIVLTIIDRLVISNIGGVAFQSSKTPIRAWAKRGPGGRRIL